MAPSPIQSRDRRTRRAQQVRAEQVRSVYLQSPNTTIGSLMAGALLVAVMWNDVPNVILIGWAAALGVHQGLRIYHYRSYLAASPAEQADPKWGRLYTMATSIAGCIWGSAGFVMFVSDSVPHQAFLSLVLYGIALVSMTSLSAYAPAFYTLIPLTLLPFVVRMWIEPGAIHIYLAAPGIIVLVLALALGRNVNRLIAETLTKRFENLDLIEELSQQKAIAEQARLQAETANRSKTQFFAAASHDLRQPLHAVGLFAAALAAKTTDPEVRNVVASINASVNALDGLFNTLLDISKIDAGAIRPELAHFPLNDVFDRLRTDFEPDAQEKKLKFRVVPNKAYAHSDQVLVERILRNLVSNAVRYTHKGGVVVGCRRRAGARRIEVWDSGVGIPAEQQSRVFDEFYQIGNPERSRARGMGLGLAIIRRLCQLLGYEITLASRPGRGSVFRFEVPLGTAPPTPPAAVEETPLPADDFTGKFIVVIDDETAIVEGMKVLLTGWNAQVLCATSGDDIVEEVGRLGALPDLIIADYQLGGGKTGIQVIASLRQALDPEIPAFIVTGSPSPERVEEALANGCELLLKPVVADRLRAMISEKLRRHRGSAAG
jgi:signal transduction histidine kinase/CheY-like chemotaxis protein